MSTRIKVCGFTRVEDAVAAAKLGVDAIGLVFYGPSPRHVSIAQAREIIAALPPFLTVVALFVNAGADEVNAVLADCAIDVLQFHGEESPEFCRSFNRPYLKAVRVQPGVDLIAYARDFHDARGLLTDAFVEGAHGGTGKVFDWTLIPTDLPLPLILSGGLDEHNVTDAVRRVSPAAVDVSSGVEAAKGVKSPQRVADFVRAVHAAQI